MLTMDKWVKAHQAQFKGQTVAFKKHVAQVCTVLQNSSASKAEYLAAAANIWAECEISWQDEHHKPVNFYCCLSVAA